MSTRDISCALGANVTGIGYRLFDDSGLIGSRVTSGITNPSPGVYVARTVTTTGATGVHWDNTAADVYADEVFETNVTPANVTQIAGQTASAAAGVTFPGTVASPTNITAGTITTVTTLTNLPAAPTDWLTAAAVKADAVTKIQAGLMLANSYTAPPSTSDIREAIFTKTISSGTYPTSQFGGLIWRIDNRAGSIYADTPTMAAQLVRIHAATVDSATVSGAVITLADGTTQTVTDSGRVTILA